MTPKERMLTALNREVPDRLPVTVHQWQGYHLKTYLGGIDAQAAFAQFGMDAAIQYFEAMGQFWLPDQPAAANLSPDWVDESEESVNLAGNRVVRHRVTTPGGTLTYGTEGNAMTTWITEFMVKRPEDTELIRKFMPVAKLDHDPVRAAYDKLGDAGILRGFVWGDQAGCWQHACCLVGTQEMVIAAMDRPEWAHEFLGILLEKKLRFVDESLVGAKFDLIETGGGAASSTVISPRMFAEFCLPYDRQIHDALHAAGHKATYHTCGGMMGILDLIPGNHCDASETLAPSSVGGDADVAEIKRRLGDWVALIGGMDQFSVLSDGTPEEIRKEVFRLFEAAGQGGGYILSASDHFFDTPPENLRVYADAARECVY